MSKRKLSIQDSSLNKLLTDSDEDDQLLLNALHEFETRREKKFKASVESWDTKKSDTRLWPRENFKLSAFDKNSTMSTSFTAPLLCIDPTKVFPLSKSATAIDLRPIVKSFSSTSIKDSGEYGVDDEKLERSRSQQNQTERKTVRNMRNCDE